jgi:carboxyl-terminal processing protease
MNKLFKNFAIIFLSAAMFTACKKVDTISPTSKNAFNSDGTPNRIVTGNIKDSVYFYAETAYLWYKNLPTAKVFDPLKYTNPEDVMTTVRTFSEKDATTGKNRDKWSFVASKADWNNIASGNSKDFGAYYRFAANGDFYIRQVFANSDMGRQGVKRGYKVISVAGLTPKNDDTFISQLIAALDKETIEMKLELPDKTQKVYNFTITDFKTNTIQEAKVFEEGTKKIGYFCFTDFLGDDTAAGLETVFNDFKAKGVNELVLDLRYNGGGYVNLAVQLANLIAPTSASGKAMLTYEYNDKLKTFNRTTNFSPSNKLNLSKIVIITTRNSASASELLINSLLPHMDVKVVGSASSGKPVGFPVIPVMDYVVAPVAFKTINSEGKADYYEGFKPDFPEVDDLTKNFGDPTEKCLAVALQYLKTGKVTVSNSKNSRIQAANQQEIWNEKLPKSFSEAVDSNPLVINGIKRIVRQSKK